jgi:hypothetical protein
MIDLAQATAQSLEWEISLREWMELKARASGNIDLFGEYQAEDGPDEQWRGRVADVLIGNNLHAKANRYIECGCYAVRFECQGKKRHPLFSPVYCDLRYCPRCAPRQFARLVTKHAPVLKHVVSHRRRGFLLREITLTSKNTGSLNSEQIKKFNEDVHETLDRLMKGIKGWGALLCDEVGFNNTNLHAHLLFYGPYISEKRLAKIWREVSGHQVVYIKRVHASGVRALLHLLKYVSKPPASDPEKVGLLEVAFHGRRRVHALGIFYNFTGPDADNLESEWKTCPHCGAELTRLPGTARIETLILEGRTFLGTRHPERKRKWLN